jgi:hypothetical protein
MANFYWLSNEYSRHFGMHSNGLKPYLEFPADRIFRARDLLAFYNFASRSELQKLVVVSPTRICFKVTGRNKNGFNANTTTFNKPCGLLWRRTFPVGPQKTTRISKASFTCRPENLVKESGFFHDPSPGRRRREFKLLGKL